MVKKFFIYNLISKKKNNNLYNVKKNKFIVYKTNIDSNVKVTQKNSKDFNPRSIKFKIIHLNDIERYKIIKIHKFVYDNSNDINKTFVNNQKTFNKNEYKKFIRSSSYRGVSKNGNKWQVLLMKNNINYYLGNYY